MKRRISVVLWLFLAECTQPALEFRATIVPPRIDRGIIDGIANRWCLIPKERTLLKSVVSVPPARLTMTAVLHYDVCELGSGVRDREGDDDA